MRHYRFVIVLFPGASLENCFRKVSKNDSDETGSREEDDDDEDNYMGRLDKQRYNITINYIFVIPAH